MEVNEQNFNLFAAKHYENLTCLNEDEFKKDLRQLSTIRRMMSKYIEGETINIQLYINNFVIFFNCFETKAAIQMIQLKIDQAHVAYYNATLKFLSLPLLDPSYDINENFYKLLLQEFQ